MQLRQNTGGLRPPLLRLLFGKARSPRAHGDAGQAGGPEGFDGQGVAPMSRRVRPHRGDDG
ncbi:hypothetical protein N177_2229 [Lutibaculum baratangense AMV1]|uniref:Uncharacterized protein n=1 Tax=Lutibaculum baratangense AMV1 TaxID=631454 RepID=V4RFJ2_9HYPH|nr:hypothetical protein N177_2229 [Lutibaculum baratangense AMV1]